MIRLIRASSFGLKLITSGSVLQRVVDNPPIVRIHRFKFDWPTGNPHGVGDLTDTLSQFVIPHRPPMADVDLHPVGIPVLGLKNSVKKKLQIFERLAVMADQGLAFSRKNLELTTALGLNSPGYPRRSLGNQASCLISPWLPFSPASKQLCLSITLAFCNLGALRNFNERGIRLFPREVHLGHEKEVLHCPVQSQP